MAEIFIYPRNDDTSTLDTRRAQVAEMEQTAGVAFPKDYRTFLIEFGGGFPWPADIRVENERVKAMVGGDIASIFEWFDPAYVNDHLNKQEFWDGTPQGYLIIGDANGVLVLLGLETSNFGNVFLWHPQTTPWGKDGNDASLLAPLSPSFVGVIDAMTDLSGEGPGKRVWENGGRRSEAREIVF